MDKIVIKSTQNFCNFFLKTDLKEDGIIGQKTRSAIDLAVTKLKAIFLEKKIGWVEDKTNWISIRTNQIVTDKYSDFLCLFIPKKPLFEGDISYQFWAIHSTSKAGSFYFQNPISHGGIFGTAILAEGQYVNSWQFITSKNWANLWTKTPYFMQIKPVLIYRDGNKNTTIDKNIKTGGLFGINIHRMGSLHSALYNWSAGCQGSPIEFYKPLLPFFTKNELYTLTLIEL